jgi:uncharacterized protein (TIGR02145 family)
MAIRFGPPKPPPPPPPTIVIGTQEWTLNNLDVTRYRNGDPIPEIQDQAAWVAATEGAWCYYNNDAANGPIYGKLYNKYAVMDARGLAPTGFHIPTYNEILILNNYLGFSTAGGALKEAGTTHWADPNTGATNSSGFTALPGGNRDSPGSFASINTLGLWWSSTVYTGTENYCFFMLYSSVFLFVSSGLPERGFSVRLIKD